MKKLLLPIVVLAICSLSVFAASRNEVKTCGPVSPRRNLDCLADSSACEREPHKNCNLATNSGCWCGHRKRYAEFGDAEPADPIVDSDGEPTPAVR